MLQVAANENDTHVEIDGTDLAMLLDGIRSESREATAGVAADFDGRRIASGAPSVPLTRPGGDPHACHQSP